MSHEKRRGNKEAKKPKSEKPKAPLAAPAAGKAKPVIGGKKLG